MVWMHIFNACTLISFSCLVLAKQVQFYDKGSDYGFAFTSTTRGDETSLLLQVSAPTSFEWAAIGTGDRMDGSLMFILYPSGNGHDITLSIRSAGGHDTPDTISSVNATILSSNFNYGRTTATAHWQIGQYHGLNKIDPGSTKQAWIWAVGPRRYLSSPSANAHIDQHSYYGLFFADMTAAQNAEGTIPEVVGTANAGTRAQGKSYRALVAIHALLLGVAFVVLLPLGVVGLRWRWSLGFDIHWIGQTIASIGALVGKGLAIAMSIIGVEYDDFNEPHQLLGICVITFIAVQAAAGYLHHRTFKVNQEEHSDILRPHMAGKDAELCRGFLLSESAGFAIGCGVVALVFGCGLEFMAFWSRRQRDRAYPKNWSSSAMELNLLTGESIRNERSQLEDTGGWPR